MGSTLLTCINGKEHPVAYYSRKLNGAEMNYSATDREMLAIVDTLRHFCHMLMGREFKVCTDHKPLFNYFGKTQELTPRKARWQNELC